LYMITSSHHQHHRGDVKEGRSRAGPEILSATVLSPPLKHQTATVLGTYCPRLRSWAS